MNYSTDEIISEVRLRAGVSDPDSAIGTPLISMQQLLNELNYVLRQTIVPIVIECGAEYFIATEDFNFIQNKSYEIPATAMGKKLRDLQVADENGQVTSGIPQIALPNATGNYYYGWFNTQYFGPPGFYIQNNKVHIFPRGVTLGPKLRMFYYRRPNECVLVSQGSTITVTGPTQFTVSPLPVGWSTTPTIDIISPDPSFDIILSDVSSSRSGATFTVSSTADMTTGDLINLAGQTSYPQIPVDLHELLITGITARIYEIMQDEDRLARALKEFDLQRATVTKLISPRVDGRNPKIVSNNNLGNYV